MKLPEGQTFFTERQLAELMHVTIWTIRDWRRQGYISFLRIGRTIRYERSQVEEFITNHRVPRRVEMDDTEPEEPVAVNA